MLQLPKLYPILDTALLDARRFAPIAAARLLLEHGFSWMQWRHKGTLTRPRLDEATEIAEMCRRRNATFIVNDRADVAMMAGAAGVHLGQEDLSPAEARHLLPPHSIIGFSTHNENQLTRSTAFPADYVALGPVFTTSSKENPDPVVGLENVAFWRELTDRPLVAIGGITRETIQDVLESGADSAAVIGDLFPAPCDEDAFRRRLDEWARLVLW